MTITYGKDELVVDGEVKLVKILTEPIYDKDGQCLYIKHTLEFDILDD